MCICIHLVNVKVVGAGITDPVVGVWNEFEVDMTQTKGGKLEVTISGPSKPEINIDHHGDGTATVKYFLTVSGDYEINVLMNGVHISGSPFKLHIKGKSSQ